MAELLDLVLKGEDRFAKGHAALPGRHGRRAGKAAEALEPCGRGPERENGKAEDVGRVGQVGPAARLLKKSPPKSSGSLFP